MSKFLTVDMGDGGVGFCGDTEASESCENCTPRCQYSFKKLEADRNQKARDFLDATNCVEGDPFWGKGIAEVIAEAGTILDEQDVPLTGRAVFQPGVGILYDPTYEEALHEVDSTIDPTDRVADLMNDNHQINKSFLRMMRTASKHRAFYIESRLRELHRELMAIVNLEEGD
jgi:hypothetical protein